MVVEWVQQLFAYLMALYSVNTDGQWDMDIDNDYLASIPTMWRAASHNMAQYIASAPHAAQQLVHMLLVLLYAAWW